MSHLLFNVGEECFATPLDDLDEVLMTPRLVPLTGAPPFLLGALNLRGEFLQVVSLARLLDADDAGFARRSSRVLRATLAVGSLGFCVDQVLEVHDFEAGQSLEGALTDSAHAAFTGSAWLFEGRPVREFALQLVLSGDQLKLLRRREATCDVRHNAS